MAAIDPNEIRTRQDLTEQLAGLFHRGGWSYHRLAADAGLAQATVFSAVNGSTGVPRATTLTALVEAFGLDPQPWVEARGRVVRAEAEVKSTAHGAGTTHGHVRQYFHQLVASHTALFAGREVESGRILDFADAHRTGYVFVEALSGYGKTSLLAHLVECNPRFCYHFISQAYRRAGSSGFDPTRTVDVLESLCEQLNPGWAPVGDPRHAAELEFRRLMATPRPTPTVLVLDGVDELESDGALRGLLPLAPPEGLVVVLSARSQGQRSPLQDVGLSGNQMDLSICLPGLDASAVVQLLGMAGGMAAPLASDGGFVTELHAVSQGDPFYLRFLVEDVAAGALTRQNLDRAPSGLAAYLDLQMEMLDRSAHLPQQVKVLGWLLEAGVLSRTDLLDIDGVTWLNFDRVIRGIHRFLLVHDDQYSFCHDRFRQYFRSKSGGA